MVYRVQVARGCAFFILSRQGGGEAGGCKGREGTKGTRKKVSPQRDGVERRVGGGKGGGLGRRTWQKRGRTGRHSSVFGVTTNNYTTRTLLVAVFHSTLPLRCEAFSSIGLRIVVNAAVFRDGNVVPAHLFPLG